MIKGLINVKTGHSKRHSHREVAANYRVSIYEKVNVQFTYMYMVINYSTKPYTWPYGKIQVVNDEIHFHFALQFHSTKFKKNVFNISLNLFKKEDNIIWTNVED